MAHPHETQIRNWMKINLDDYIDECNEVDATRLAESACQHFGDYEKNNDYSIPDRYFDIAAEIANYYESNT